MGSVAFRVVLAVLVLVIMIVVVAAMPAVPDGTRYPNPTLTPKISGHP